jgi:hypothetical protein
MEEMGELSIAIWFSWIELNGLIDKLREPCAWR